MEGRRGGPGASENDGLTRAGHEHIIRPNGTVRQAPHLKLAQHQSGWAQHLGEQRRFGPRSRNGGQRGAGRCGANHKKTGCAAGPWCRADAQRTNQVLNRIVQIAQHRRADRFRSADRNRHQIGTAGAKIGGGEGRLATARAAQGTGGIHDKPLANGRVRAIGVGGLLHRGPRQSDAADCDAERLTKG